MNLLVTGGCGFIGSTSCASARGGSRGGSFQRLVNLDQLPTRQSGESRECRDARYVFVRGDIGDVSLVSHLLAEHAIDAVVNFAAMHVDRSIDSPERSSRTTSRTLAC